MKNKRLQILLFLFACLLMNTATAQHRLSLSAHYGIAVDQLSFLGTGPTVHVGTPGGIPLRLQLIPEYNFQSRHQTQVKLDYSENRLHLRLGYVYWQNEINITYRQYGRLDPAVTTWTMNLHGIETGMGITLLRKNKLQWIVHASVITPYFYRETEYTGYTGKPVTERKTQYIDFNGKYSAYRLSNELEVKINKYFSISQELSFQYYPKFITYFENQPKSLYSIQGSIGLKWLIWDSERKKEAGK